MKAIEQYFHVVLFIMLYKVVLTFTFVDTAPLCDHSNENYWVVLSLGSMLYNAVLSTFKSDFATLTCDQLH